jgi:hypothetical protein
MRTLIRSLQTSLVVGALALAASAFAAEPRTGSSCSAGPDDPIPPCGCSTDDQCSVYCTECQYGCFQYSCDTSAQCTGGGQGQCVIYCNAFP